MARHRLFSEAKEELEAAVSFYESEYPGLGQDFAIEVRRLIRVIVESPYTGLEVRPEIRRRILRRFPYSILYTMENEDILGECQKATHTHATRKLLAVCPHPCL
jgi:hypothetical protein